MNRASPEPPSLILIINFTYAKCNDGLIYAHIASCLPDRNKPRMNTQDKVLVESANSRQTPSVAAAIAPPNKFLTLCLATFLLH